MIELRFHQELYDGFAVDEAAKVYGPYGAIELAREPDAYVVRVTVGADAASQGIDERTLAAEIANYALGATIEKQGAAQMIAARARARRARPADAAACRSRAVPLPRGRPATCC